MNKIKVVNNKIIPFISDDVEINDNSINFNNNGNYFIDYIDCNNVSLCINVNNNKCIHLFEYSNNNDINFNIKYNLDMDSSLIISKFYYNNKCNEVKKYLKFILEIYMMNDYNSLEDFNIVRDTMKAGNYYMFFHKVHPIVSTYGVLFI